MFVFAFIEDAHRPSREQQETLWQLQELQQQQRQYHKDKVLQEARFDILRRHVLDREKKVQQMEEQLEELRALPYRLSRALDYVLHGLHLLQESLRLPPPHEHLGGDEEDVDERQ